MNRIIKIMLLFLISYLNIGCDGKESNNCHKFITFRNDFIADIYVDGSFSYPDTSIRFQPNFADKIGITKNKPALWGRDCYENKFAIPYINDTLMIFVFDAQVFENTHWDSVVKDYMIIKRYDVSLQDLRDNDWLLTYPPTEAMKDIKQFPPYGSE